MAKIKKICFKQAKQIIEEGEYTLLDVREEDEFATGHAEGACCMPVDEIDADFASTLIPTLDTPVMVYCRTGQRSKLAAERLSALGYQKIYDLGSLSEWPYGIDYGA